MNPVLFSDSLILFKKKKKVQYKR